MSVLPRSLGQTFELAQSRGHASSRPRSSSAAGLFRVTIVGIVFVQEGTAPHSDYFGPSPGRPGKVYREEPRGCLPLRLNQGGVMPIIFASSVLIVPSFLAQSLNNPFLVQVANVLSPNCPALGLTRCFI